MAVTKTASRGEGIFVLLNAASVPESDVIMAAKHFAISKAFLCDARERNLGLLEVWTALFEWHCQVQLQQSGW